MVNKVKQYFSDMGDKIKTSMRIDKQAPFFYLSIILIFILAVLVRLSPRVENTSYLIKAFDAWYQFDSFKALTEMGLYDWLHFRDYQFWYPQGVARYNLRPGLLLAASFCYWVLNGLGIPVTHFEVAYYFPAFMGGITVIVMYYLGKEILDRKAGLISAFFLAFSPGHMQRTVAGFFDNETVGVFSVLLTFLFFIKAVKYGKLSNGIFAGISLGFLSLSWGGLTFVYGLIPVLVVILILINKYNSRVLMAYSTTIGIGILIYSINPGTSWSKIITDFEVIIPLITLVFLLFYHTVYTQKGTGIYKTTFRIIKIASIPAAIALAIILWQAPEILPFNLGGRLLSILNPNIRETFNLVASVGEHAPSPWSVFYFNAMIPVLLTVPGFYFALRRGNAEDILMIIFVLTLFYFTGSMIRIILIFTPAINLLAGYALSNLSTALGRIMRKQTRTGSRRKRQVKRVLGRSEAFVAYSLIAILLFVQANHAADYAENQLPYADIVSAGSFHDWEETLTWTKNNLPGTTVIVSWWDYGYWLTTIGNVTTVNDNGTWNQTRIGLTGMAMMQNNERYSAELFQVLKADYVLVYFGHLLNGIGGDEGKWPWMVRICNDNTNKYEKMAAIPEEIKESFYSEDEVFNEANYINSSSGKYRENWFGSTLVKLMFYGEAERINQAGGENQLINYLARQLQGDSEVDPRTDDYGNEWWSYDSINGNLELDYFNEAYFSSNHLVKIFEVDYTALNSAFTVKDPYIDTDGNGYAKLTNIGSEDLEITSVGVEDEGNVNFTIQNSGDPSISPGESRYVWFNAYELPTPLSIATGFNVEIEAKAGDYTLRNTSSDSQVVNPQEIDLKIDQTQSKVKKDGANVNVEITIENPTTKPDLLTNITINENVIPIADWSSNSEPILIGPSSTETLIIDNLDILENITYLDEVEVTVSTRSGTKKQNTLLPISSPEYDLTIAPYSLVNLPDKEYRFDYSTYQEITTDDEEFYIPYNSETYLLENGTIQIQVENTGQDDLALEYIYANGIQYDNFEVITDGTFPPSMANLLEPGDKRTIRATLDDVERNTPIKVYITAMNEETVAADYGYFVPRNQSQMIEILDAFNSMTALFANETIRLVVKNVGSESIELTEVVLNSTESQNETIMLTNDMVVDGSLDLTPNEIALLNIPISNFKLNVSSELNVMLHTEAGEVFDESLLAAKVPTLEKKIRLISDEGSLPSHAFGEGTKTTELLMNLMIEVSQDSVLNLDGIYYKTEGETSYSFINWVNVLSFTNNTGDAVDYEIEGAEEGENSALYYAEIDVSSFGFSSGDSVWVKIITEEGYEATLEIMVA